jgi:hypothetical protein
MRDSRNVPMIAGPPQQEGKGESIVKLFISRVVLITMFVCGSALADTDEQPVLAFSDFSDTGGNSFLTRLDNMIPVTLEAEDLTPGDAMTLWFVVFNNPAGCYVLGHCGEFDEDFSEAGIISAEIGLGNASGNVVKSNGTLEFGGILRQGSNDDHQIIFGAGFGEHLLTADPHDAEVHLVLQSHGQGRGGKKLREQLTYLEANCTPSCADLQFAIHKP